MNHFLLGILCLLLSRSGGFGDAMVMTQVRAKGVNLEQAEFQTLQGGVKAICVWDVRGLSVMGVSFTSGSIATTQHWRSKPLMGSGRSPTSKWPKNRG